MADSQYPFGTVATGQGDQVTAVNALLDACSTAALFGRNNATSTGLTWGFHGGHPTLSTGAIATIASATVALTASSTNYVVALKSSGAVSVATTTTNWNNTADYWRLYIVTTNATGPVPTTGIVDYREIALMTGMRSGFVAPVTKTASFTLAENENEVICNGTASITVTLPTASSWTGRKVRIKTRAAYTVVSASSNVKPLDTDTAGTAILAATAGKWAELVSDGSNWVIMAGN